MGVFKINWVRAGLMGLLVGLSGLSPLAQEAMAQGRALTDGYRLKGGASFSQSWIEVTNISTGQVATLNSDGEASPSLSFSTPPWFVGIGGLAIGVSATYNEFSASEQTFSGGPGGVGPQATGSTASGTLVTVTPEVVYFIGKNSPTQYFRVAAGVGFGVAKFSGFVQFGDTLGAEPPQPFQSPNGTLAAVSASLEYRFRNLVLGFVTGGPTGANDVHSFKWGDSTYTLGYVIRL